MFITEIFTVVQIEQFPGCQIPGGLGNDIPILSLYRMIETDLLEILGETKVPPPIETMNGVLL